MAPAKGLLERLNDGETILCAEGYVMGFERQGYIKSGPFVPEVVIDHPELVRQMYRDFVHAGSDVVPALTYYASRKKLSDVDREDKLELTNRLALKMAREVADETETLMCGDISNTGDWDPDDEGSKEAVRVMFKEQVEWAVEEGADYIIAETFSIFGEAMMALECIKEYGKGLPAVVTISPRYMGNGRVELVDDVEMIDGLRQLEAAGAAVVGFNCAYGPATMIDLLEKASKVGLKIPIAALPVVYRTEMYENWFQLKDAKTEKLTYPTDIDCNQCNRSDIKDFTKKCIDLGIQYMGLCCGNAPHFTRTMAETLGRKPRASRYSPDMSLSVVFGTSDKIRRNSSKLYSRGTSKLENNNACQ
ncbi:betaine--homocysteine S-methyltransferase 1 [Strongylocentrotus purpuratus]|uniref:Hcy-binding domain-containing protein n=1 Tax=Strongylocentrotus purpuratus TaxID=7668 RepID=A0A7M7RFY7_STRPU|nr:betaine--homocysteine S-methyltransferase 1 [Strongylocentrotus purpuratus]